MPDPTTCPSCGNPVQDGAKFCVTCGTPTGPTPVVPPDDSPTTGAPPPAGPPAADAGPPVTGFGTGTGTGPHDPWGAEEGHGDEEDPVPLGPSAAPPPGGWGAPTSGERAGAEGFPSTVANPVAAGAVALPPTMADQAVASAGGAPPAGPPTGPGGPVGPDGEDVPHWMPDPSKESQSSRTGILVVLGVAAGVLITLILLAIVLVANSGGDDDVSSGDTTTSTTEAETTTTTERETTTSTTEAETTTTTQASTTTTTSSGGTTPLAALAVGDCVTDDVSGELTDFDVVDCDDSHRAEMYAVFNLPAGPYPQGSAANDLIEQRCLGDAFEDYVGISYQSSSIWVTGVFPDEAGWNQGTRSISCFGHEQDASDTFTGTIRNSNR